MEPQITNSQTDKEDSGQPELHLYECAVCGYVYDPVSGDDKKAIAPGTPFELVRDDWRCPVCSARKNKFRDIGLANKPSGFKENLRYGLGVNVLTPGQKNALIFGTLALGFLLFMSFYALD